MGNVHTQLDSMIQQNNDAQNTIDQLLADLDPSSINTPSRLGPELSNISVQSDGTVDEVLLVPTSPLIEANSSLNYDELFGEPIHPTVTKEMLEKIETSHISSNSSLKSEDLFETPAPPYPQLLQIL